MPAVSQAQRRFFGALVAYKRGKLKNPSNKLKEASQGISESSAIDFASSVKRKNLGNTMAKSMKRKGGY